MSIYDFYPMKKRRLSLCKTPNGGRSASTLGKLKKTSEQLASTVDSGIEVYWDNNSPSPTTTLALAGKRRRRRQNNRGDENNETTDISFVVQKLSENTSPVVNHPNSALLEMWVNKEQNGDDCDEEFTSPPNQTRHDKRKAVLATPLNQRRTSKRMKRQFMLEIRKLVDEIQKSDINSLASLPQRDSQKVQEQVKRPESNNGADSSTTNSKPLTSPKPQTHTTTAPEPLMADPEDGTDDSFEWTEDDMDELILTCQLSSSGKGSLDVPDAPRPNFGLSPSYILTHVPETQPMLSRDQDAVAAGKPRDTHESREDMSWEVNFGEDDSLLETAAQEFELSQKSPSKDFPTKIRPSEHIPRKDLPAQSTRLIRASSPGHPKGNDKSPKMSAAAALLPSRVPSSASSVSRVASAASSVSRVPSAASSVSRVPSAASSVSRVPSAASSVSRAPSAAPSVSRVPSAAQSVSRIPSTASSVSRVPSAASVSRVTSAASSVSRVPSAASSVSRVPSAASSVSPAPSAAPSVSRVPSTASSVSRVPSAASSISRVPTTAECRQDSGQKKNVLRSYHGNKASAKAPSNCHGDRPSVAPPHSTLGNPMEPVKGHQMKSQLQKNIDTPSLRQGPSTSTSLAAKHRTPGGRCDGKSVPSDDTKTLPKDIECLLFGDNIAALFDDFNFEESLNVITRQAAPVPLSNTACKTSSDTSGRSSTTQTKKATYSKEDIERKRLEAQQRRLVKLRATSSRATTRKPKIR